MIASAPVLDLVGVGRTFAGPRGPAQVLRDIRFTLPAGGFLAITGPSGSGKSTLLHLCGLLDHPTTGALRFRGADTGRLAPEETAALRARYIGTVFQRFHLLPHRSVLDNVLFRYRYVDADPRDARRRANELLERLGLAGHRDQPARLLSGGEMQRVALARALVLPPALVLADEPTGNLDADAGRTVMAILRALPAEGCAVILATHNPALLEGCTHHLALESGSRS